MTSLRHALSAPLLVLGVTATAFVAWVVSDARSPQSVSQASASRANTDEPAGPSHAALLSALHPGVPRAFVERKLAVLPHPVHERIDLSGTTPICRVRYQIHLSHPVPHLDWTLQKDFVPGPYSLTLEYDGGIDGQPLVRALVAGAN